MRGSALGALLVTILAVLSPGLTQAKAFRPLREILPFAEFQKLVLFNAERIFPKVWAVSKEMVAAGGEPLWWTGSSMRGLIRWTGAQLQEFTPDQIRQLPPPQYRSLLPDGGYDMDIIGPRGAANEQKVWQALEGQVEELDYFPEHNFQEMLKVGGASIEKTRINPAQRKIDDPYSGLLHYYNGLIVFVDKPLSEVSKVTLDDARYSRTVEAIRAMRQAKTFTELSWEPKSIELIRAIPQTDFEFAMGEEARRDWIVESLFKLCSAYRNRDIEILKLLKKFNFLEYVANMNINISVRTLPTEALLKTHGFSDNEIDAIFRILHFEWPNKPRSQANTVPLREDLKDAATRLSSGFRIADVMTFEKFKELLIHNIQRIPEMKEFWAPQNEAARKETFLMGGRLMGFIRWHLTKLKENPDVDLRFVALPTESELQSMGGTDTDIVGPKNLMTFAEQNLHGVNNLEYIPRSKFDEMAKPGGLTLDVLAIGPSGVLDPLGGLKHLWEGRLAFHFIPDKEYFRLPLAKREGYTRAASGFRFARAKKLFPELGIDPESINLLSSVFDTEQDFIAKQSENESWPGLDRIVRATQKLVVAYNTNTSELAKVLRDYHLIKVLVRNQKWIPSRRSFRELVASGELKESEFSPEEWMGLRQIIRKVDTSFASKSEIFWKTLQRDLQSARGPSYPPSQDRETTCSGLSK